VRVAFGWVHRAAVILRNKTGLDAAGVRRRYRGLIGAIARHRRAAGRLAEEFAHFLRVTRSYWPGLFRCYEVGGLPRTNNELEQFFGRHRYHERRARGGKQGSPSLVPRGPARLLAASATRQRTYGAWELAQADPARCAELRAELEARRQRRVQRRRFRRDPEGFLRSLEEEFLKRTLPS
jgi:hypothetical protein